MYSFLFAGMMLLALPLLPVFYLQGRWLRRRLPTSLPAQGNPFGTCTGTGAPLNLLVIGESTVEGVGVARYEQTISAQIATQLQRTICWQALGKIGAKVGYVRKHLVPQINQAVSYNVIIIMLGANDSIKLTAPANWQRELSGLIDDLQIIQPQALIYVAPLPPVRLFRALPHPTRFFLGLANQLLVGSTKQIASFKPQVIFSKLTFTALPDDFFSNDGVHPSEQGYQEWATNIVMELTPYLVKTTITFT